jgi:hypothetical protein
LTRKIWPRTAVALIGLIAAVLTAGCSSENGEATVLRLPLGGEGGPATTIDTVDIGVLTGSQNVTGSSVRLERISLVSVPSSVRLDSFYAYPPGQGGVGLITGNLPRDCPKDKWYPVTAVVVPPHKQLQWNVVIGLTFTKPGTYDVRRVKVFYVANGHSGWQYSEVHTTMVVSAARKGAKPQLTGCQL